MTGLAAPVHEQHGPIAIVPPDVGDEMNALESFEPHDPRIHDGHSTDSGDVRTAGGTSITRYHSSRLSCIPQEETRWGGFLGRPRPVG